MLNLTQGGLSGGYRKYLRRVAPLLRRHPAVSDLMVGIPPGEKTLLDADQAAIAWPPVDPWLGFPRLAARVRAWRPDVIFVPTARWIDAGAPAVIMVRNMEPFADQPAGSPARWLRRRAMARAARRAAERAARVVVVSRFVADHVEAAWRIPADRIGVVYHGVDRVTPSTDPPGELAGVRFLFAAGSLLPYRGLEDAIGALAQLDRPDEADVILAIAGSGSAGYRARIVSLARALGVQHRVRWLGQLEAPALAWAYESCAAFLMTSRVEACPNTALEAMAQGAVCISTECRPMPEFFETGASYYAAGDVDGLTARVRSALALSTSERRAVRSAAAQRAGRFPWEETVARTVEQLLRVHHPDEPNRSAGR
jgi:glycosyltransferase involved in cell wall biosynthesis